jgi:hypothetical protein
MDSNRCSNDVPEELAELAAAVDRVAAPDLDRLTDIARAHWLLTLRRLVDRQEGYWLQALANLDARGAAGADQGTPAPSTASWLRNRLRMGASAVTSAVRTARALFRGPLTKTAQGPMRRGAVGRPRRGAGSCHP